MELIGFIEDSLRKLIEKISNYEEKYSSIIIKIITVIISRNYGDKFISMYYMKYVFKKFPRKFIRRHDTRT